MERIARREVKYVGYFESDPIRCASDPIRIFLLAGLVHLGGDRAGAVLVRVD